MLASEARHANPKTLDGVGVAGVFGEEAIAALPFEPGFRQGLVIQGRVVAAEFQGTGYKGGRRYYMGQRWRALRDLVECYALFAPQFGQHVFELLGAGEGMPVLAAGEIR